MQKPSTPNDEELFDDGERFFPPMATEASRIPSLKGIGSYRGTIPNIGANIEIVIESKLEGGFANTSMVDGNVVWIREQPPPVSFVDAAGKLRSHTFDFLVLRKSKLRVAVDIKPKRRILSTGLDVDHELIKAQVGAAFADIYLILTEEDLHPDAVADARLLLRARRTPDAEADSAVLRFLPPKGGSTSIKHIVSATGLEAAAFNAVVRLIDDGRLAISGDGRIDYGAAVFSTTSQ